MKKILYVLQGVPDFHISESAGRLIGEGPGRGRPLRAGDDHRPRRVRGAASRADYAAVVVYTTGCHDELRGAREAGLLQFVRGWRRVRRPSFGRRQLPREPPLPGDAERRVPEPSRSP